MIIEMPDKKHWAEKRKIFYSIASSLFLYLRDAIINKAELNFDKLHQCLETWKAFAEIDNVLAFNRWRGMRNLLYCAEKAYAESVFEQHVDVADLLNSVVEDRAWIEDCIRLLQNKDNSVHSAQIPVAVSNPRTGTGYVFFLNLDILEAGNGKFFHHPIDKFVTLPSEDFNISMQNAWRAACNLFGDCNKSIQYDARWRLLDKSKKPIIELIDGMSASGAAARCLFYALSKMAFNKGVVVLAQVDKGGMLSDVVGIKEKVKAIGAYDTLNTIIVASEGKKSEVQDAVKEFGNVNVAVLSVEPGVMSFERLIKETEIIISARIDKYHPNQLIQIEIDKPIQFYMEIMNTGNVDWTFVAMVDLWDSEGSLVAYPNEEVCVKVGQQTTVELSCSVRKPGNYWVQFTAWKAKPFNKRANRLTRTPIPSQHLITVISP